MFRRLERHSTSFFLVALLAVAGGVVLADYHAAQRLAAERLVVHTHDVLSELDAAVASLSDAESEVRGYALSGNEELVTSFERAAVLAEEHLANAGTLDASDPLQRERVDALALASGRALATMRAFVHARRSGTMDSSALAREVEASEAGISEIRDSVRALERDERGLLAAREVALDLSVRHTSWAVFALGVASMVMLVIAYLTAWQALRRERVAERRSLEANHELRLRVADLVGREREIAGLQELSEALQICLTSEEAHTAIALIIPGLVETCTGGFLAVASSARGSMERVASWGTLAGDDSVAVIASGDCCALRGGRPYVVQAGSGHLRCAHVPEGVRDYVCLPLVAHGESLGVLHVALAPIDEEPDAGADVLNRADDEPAYFRDSYEWPAPGHDGARLALLRRAGGQIAVTLANLALRERLERQSIRDPLTNAFNRRYFDESLDRDLLRARRNGRGLSLVLFDIDHFKSVNDKHGHDAGDEVLRAVARILHQGVRGADVVCRYGGEEFAIILPEIAPDVALGRIQSILAACRSHRVVLGKGGAVGVTISAGIAHFSPGESGVELTRRADAALYAAKRAGRDRLVEADAGESNAEAETLSV